MGDGNAPSATDAGASHIFRKTVDTKVDEGSLRLQKSQTAGPSSLSGVKRAAICDAADLNEQLLQC